MRIALDALGKRYQRHWVFRNLNHGFAPGSSTAILGQNGSGKSTLLRIISGMQPASIGKISWQNKDEMLQQEEVFHSISFCAPAMELPEELTLEETLRFHFSFKKFLPGLSILKIIDLAGLVTAKHKPISDFSSGMKQRVKLAQAIFADTPLLLLDEPCTNLDDAGVAQFSGWINTYAAGRTLIIASNDPREYRFCDEQLIMREYQ